MKSTVVRQSAVVGVVLLAAAGCAGPRAVPPLAVRLVDEHRPAAAAERAAAAAPAGEPEARLPGPATAWRFDGAPPEPPPLRAAATWGWEAGPGVADLALRAGRLRGRSTSAIPVLHLERPAAVAAGDVLHSLEITVRVSAGTQIAAAFAAEERFDLAQALAAAQVFGWRTTAALTPGPDLQTLTVRPSRPVPAAELRHVLIRPTDAAGADFEIAAIRLVSRREHLAAIPSGVSWQGLGDVYRETLVARAPETLDFAVTPPPRALLDLAVGTVEEGALTFRVGVRPSGAPRGVEEVVLQRTVTRAHRWEAATADLTRWAGRPVEVTLTLGGGRPGALGLWGSPVLRARGIGPASPQGVILVWADTLRSDHLSAYGYGRPTDPVLRRLAGEGTRFAHCLSQGTWTKVATPSLLASLYPLTHGVRDFGDRLPAAATTLAEVYRGAGYATLSLSSVLFTGAFTNLHQGFEELHEDGSLPDQTSSKTAREYVDRLLPWLERHREVPFFVFLHVTDPHDPYEPAAPYDRLWADPARKGRHHEELERARAVIADPLLRRFGMPTRGELEAAGVDADAYAAHDRDWYDGAIRGMDAELGRLVERLGELGLGERTLVALAGDHGEEFLEHGRMFHGQSVYGELTDVPLVLWQPGRVPAGRVVEEPVEIVDLLPTLLEASGLTVPAAAQGRSLVPLLASGRGAPAGRRPRPAFAEKAPTRDPGAPPPHDTEAYAVVAGGWRLIHHVRRPAGAPEYELFDERRDPRNRRDLAPGQPERVRELAAVLTRWRAAAAAARLPPDAVTAQAMDPASLERLRSLGYIQ